MTIPGEYKFGFVVGRFLQMVADTAGDTDPYPDPRPARGTVTFTPHERQRKVSQDFSAFVGHATVGATLGDRGQIVDAEGRDGIWLIEGTHTVRVTNDAGIVVPDFDITVTPDHTIENPLDLVFAAPPQEGKNVTIVTAKIPAGGTAGDVLVPKNGGTDWDRLDLQPVNMYALGEYNDSGALTPVLPESVPLGLLFAYLHDTTIQASVNTGAAVSLARQLKFVFDRPDINPPDSTVQFAIPLTISTMMGGLLWYRRLGSTFQCVLGTTGWCKNQDSSSSRHPALHLRRVNNTVEVVAMVRDQYSEEYPTFSTTLPLGWRVGALSQTIQNEYATVTFHGTDSSTPDTVTFERSSPAGTSYTLTGTILLPGSSDWPQSFPPNMQSYYADPFVYNP